MKVAQCLNILVGICIFPVMNLSAQSEVINKEKCSTMQYIF